MAKQLELQKHIESGVEKIVSDMIKATLKNPKEAIRSSLFQKLQDEGVLAKTHIGGCVLFEQRDKVEDLLKR